jgi:hypothetical protein
MSCYPELTTEAAAECTKAAHGYDPACYCVIHWNYRDPPPGRKYLKYPSKWLEASIWRSLPEGTPDRWVLAVAADTGPNLLRLLREALTAVAKGQRPDPSLLASTYYCHAVRNAVAHPLLPAQQLISSLHELAARLPNYEAQALATELEAAIDKRASQAHRPPEGGGWIASQPRTTYAASYFPP